MIWTQPVCTIGGGKSTGRPLATFIMQHNRTEWWWSVTAPDAIPGVWAINRLFFLAQQPPSSCEHSKLITLHGDDRGGRPTKKGKIVNAPPPPEIIHLPHRWCHNRDTGQNVFEDSRLRQYCWPVWWRAAWLDCDSNVSSCRGGLLVVVVVVKLAHNSDSEVKRWWFPKSTTTQVIFNASVEHSPEIGSHDVHGQLSEDGIQHTHTHTPMMIMMIVNPGFPLEDGGTLPSHLTTGHRRFTPPKHKLREDDWCFCACVSSGKLPCMKKLLLLLLSLLLFNCHLYWQVMILSPTSQLRSWAHPESLGNFFLGVETKISESVELWSL